MTQHYTVTANGLKNSVNQNGNSNQNLLCTTQKLNAPVSKKSFKNSFMKKIYLYLMLLICFSAVTVNAQIGVAVTNPGNATPAFAASYTSFTQAVAALNTVTAMTGPVTFTLTAGTSETAPIKGFNISTSAAGVLSATNTLTIVKAGGAATVINAGVGTAAGPAASPDGMLYLNGSDYVTINGLTFTDANTASATVAMEYGIAFFKRTAGDGCNNNTIQNCIFNMQRINNTAGSGPMFDGSWAIEVLNSTTIAATTALTPTNAGTLATNGTNSNNKFYTNTINNGNGGIGLSGFAASLGVGPTPTATTFLGDLGNDIGGSVLANGNSILNFGGGAATSASAGIRLNNQWSSNIQYNNLDNNNGSGVSHTTTLRGIYAQAGTSANITISNNTVSLKGGGTISTVTAIDNIIGSTAAVNTVTISNNTVQNCTYNTGTSATLTFISNTASAATVAISGNTVQNNTYTGAATTGVWIGIVNTAAAIVNINSNTINNISSAVTGTCYGIGVGSPVGAGCTANSNTVSNITRTGASGIQRGIIYTSPTNNMTFNGNTIDGISFTNTASTGIIDGIYSLSSGTNTTINGNFIRNLSTPTTGAITGIRDNTISGNKFFQNNFIYNFTTTAGGVGGATMYGIYLSVGNLDVSGNQIYNLTSTGSTGGTGGVVYGVFISGGTTNNIYKNKIYDINSNSTAPTVAGITISSGTTNTVYNNLIGGITAAFASGFNPVIGINVTGGTTDNIYYNSVLLSGTSAGADFGSSAFYIASGTPALTLRNNIL